MIARRHQLDFIRVNRGRPNYWAAVPSGNASEDWARGFKYGRQAVAFMEQVEDHPHLLFDIVRDMPERELLGELEAGFLEAVATAAILHHNSLRWGWIERSFFGDPIVFPGFSAPKARAEEFDPHKERP